MERDRLDNTRTDCIMVVHGPVAFDKGDVARIIHAIPPGRVIVAGVMGRTAAEESGITHETCDSTPSEIIRSLGDESVFLVNHGKNPESGRIFGEIIAGKIPDNHGLVHIECSNNTVYCWNAANSNLAHTLANKLGFSINHLQSTRADHSCRRTIRGCLPGEAVFVNGIVIGYATAETVIIEWTDKGITPVSGIEEKPHGIEKIRRKGYINLSAAWCKSGVIRMKPPRGASRRDPCGHIVVIDHAGHELYKRCNDGVCGILSIGDDTTAVCGHICAHLGIPVFGIIDGDADGIVEPAYPPGSVIVEVINGRDDEIGTELAKTIDENLQKWPEFVKNSIIMLEGKVRILVDRIEDADELC